MERWFQAWRIKLYLIFLLNILVFLFFAGRFEATRKPTTVRISFVKNEVLVNANDSDSSKLCKKCNFGYNCKLDFKNELIYLPIDKGETQPLAKKPFPYNEFKTYLEQLPNTFFQDINTPLRQDLTVGKMIRSWMNSIVEFSVLRSQAVFPILSKVDCYWLPLEILQNKSDLATLSALLNIDSEGLIKSSDSWLETDVMNKGSKAENIELFSTNEAKDNDLQAAELIYLWFYSIRYIFTELFGNSLQQVLSLLIDNRIIINPLGMKQQQSQGSFKIAVHVRRGDACVRFTSILGDADFSKGRPCYHLNLYFENIIKVKNELAVDKQVHILLVTDSSSVVSDFTSFSKQNNLILEYLNFSREVFKVSNGNKENFIEIRETTKIERFHIFLSILADLSFASSADFFIGTSLSWVSRLLFFYISGVQEKITGFIFLDTPLISKQFSSLIWWESEELENLCTTCTCPNPS